MPEPRSVKVSADKLGDPRVERFPPLGLIELAQPLPAVPLLPHGHAVPVPSPKQYTMELVPTVYVRDPTSSRGVKYDPVGVNGTLRESPVVKLRFASEY